MTRGELGDDRPYFATVTATSPPTFSCRALAQLRDGRTVAWGHRDTRDASAALLWVGWRAGHLADQLDFPLARTLWAWREDSREHRRALGRLARGAVYTVAVRDEDVAYLLTITPPAPVECSCGD